jgi:hypothetical protein
MGYTPDNQQMTEAEADLKAAISRVRGVIEARLEAGTAVYTLEHLEGLAEIDRALVSLRFLMAKHL